MDKQFTFKGIEEKTKKTLRGQVMLFERITPKVKNSHLALERDGEGFKAAVKGQYGSTRIFGRSEGKTPLGAYLKAYKQFLQSIERVQVREEIEDSMSGFSAAF